MFALVTDSVPILLINPKKSGPCPLTILINETGVEAPTLPPKVILLEREKVNPKGPFTVLEKVMGVLFVARVVSAPKLTAPV